jgi:hypothetical protein
MGVNTCPRFSGHNPLGGPYIVTVSLPASEDPEFLILLGVGRSGTTIIQTLLNSIPGYRINGENGGVLWPLLRSTERLKKTLGENSGWPSYSPSDPWYGLHQVGLQEYRREVGRVFIQQILRPGEGDRVVGFKDIRFPGRDLTETLEELIEVFPSARVIANFRKSRDIATSGWWVSVADAEEQINRLQSELARAADAIGERCHQIYYEEFHASREPQARLFQWLGEKYSPAAASGLLSKRLLHMHTKENGRSQ